MMSPEVKPRLFQGTFYLIFIVFLFTYHLFGQTVTDNREYVKALELKRNNDFKEALLHFNSALSTALMNHDSTSTIRIRTEIASVYRTIGQYDSAISILEEVLADALKMNGYEVELVAGIYYEYGADLIHIGELDDGKRFLEKAIDIYKEKAGVDDTLLAPCYNKMGNYYYFKNKKDSALLYYQKAYTLVSNLSNSFIELPNYMVNLGIGYYEVGNFEKAEELFQKAIDEIVEFNPPNHYLLTRAYSNFGKFYFNISMYDKALKFLNLAEDLSTKYHLLNQLEIGYQSWNKSTLFLSLGDINKAFNYIHQAKQIILENSSQDSPLLSALNMDQAVIYESVGLKEEAITLYHQALMRNTAEPVKLKTYRNLANLYKEMGKTVEAGKYFDSCFAILQFTNLINPVEKAYTDLYYGEFLLDSGQKTALAYLEDSYKLFEEIYGLKHRDVAMALSMIGDYYMKFQQIDSAIYYYHQSAIAITPSFNEPQFLSNPSLEELSIDQHSIRILSKKAEALEFSYQSTGDFTQMEAALELYDMDIYIVEQFGKLFRSEDGRMKVKEKFHFIYKHAVLAYLQAFEQTSNKRYFEKAFEISEKSKAAILLSEMKDENAKNLGLVPDEMFELEKSLRGNLYMYKKNILDEESALDPNSKKLVYLRNGMFSYEKKYDSLLNVYEKKYPLYYRLKYDQSVISVSRMQDRLKADEALLEFTLTEDKIIIFLIKQKDFNFRIIDADSSLIRNIFELRKNLVFARVSEYKFKDYIQYQHLANGLYKQLIQPVEPELAVRNLIIVPDGELAYLSFESLTDSFYPSDTINFRNLPYLINKYSITYASSATIFSMAEKGPKPHINKGVLALAPSYPLVKRSIIQNYGDFGGVLLSNRDLPGAVWEADAVLQIIKGYELTGEDATEANFKKKAGDYDILHFAMHARIDDENPLSSMLSFYPLGDPSEDDVLHTYEIYNLPLKGHLAVLSACSTGDGILQKGEGVISLARAFAFAGVPSILMTLWDVEDMTSGFIIPDFYYLLADGHSKDQALRLAKLNYIKTVKNEIEAHPAFWSGFVIYGNRMPFSKQIIKVLKIILFILAILFIWISFILVRRYMNFKKERTISDYYIDQPD